MFYSHELLCRKRNGRFSLVWLCAHKGDSFAEKIPRRQALSVVVHSVVDDLVDIVLEQYPDHLPHDGYSPKRFSIHLASTLLCGCCRLLKRQTCLLLSDLISLGPNINRYQWHEENHSFTLMPIRREQMEVTHQKPHKDIPPNRYTTLDFPPDDNTSPEFPPDDITSLEYVRDDDAPMEYHNSVHPSTITLQELEVSLVNIMPAHDKFTPGGDLGPSFDLLPEDPFRMRDSGSSDCMQDSPIEQLPPVQDTTIPQEQSVRENVTQNEDINSRSHGYLPENLSGEDMEIKQEMTEFEHLPTVKPVLAVLENFSLQSEIRPRSVQEEEPDSPTLPEVQQGAVVEVEPHFPTLPELRQGVVQEVEPDFPAAPEFQQGAVPQIGPDSDVQDPLPQTADIPPRTLRRRKLKIDKAISLTSKQMLDRVANQSETLRVQDACGDHVDLNKVRLPGVDALFSQPGRAFMARSLKERFTARFITRRDEEPNPQLPVFHHVDAESLQRPSRRRSVERTDENEEGSRPRKDPRIETAPVDQATTNIVPVEQEIEQVTQQQIPTEQPPPGQVIDTLAEQIQEEEAEENFTKQIKENIPVVEGPVPPLEQGSAAQQIPASETPAEQQEQPVTSPQQARTPWNTDSVLTELQQIKQTTGKNCIQFEELCPPKRTTKFRAASVFSALLGLHKEAAVYLDQDASTAPITIQLLE